VDEIGGCGESAKFSPQTVDQKKLDPIEIVVPAVLTRAGLVHSRTHYSHPFTRARGRHPAAAPAAAQQAREQAFGTLASAGMDRASLCVTFFGCWERHSPDDVQMWGCHPRAVAWVVRTTESSPGIWVFFFSSRRRHTRLVSDWSSDVCSSD